MIKLYNFSGLPDEPLRSIILAAQRAAQCKGSVVVKVTRGGYHVRSHAKRSGLVAKWFLSSRAYTKASERCELKKGYISTDGGYVILQPLTSCDPLKTATRLFETAIHEFVHIKDMQESAEFRYRDRATGKSLQWEDRPHERRTCVGTTAALTRIQKRREQLNDMLIDLGVQIEDKARAKEAKLSAVSARRKARLLSGIPA